MHRVTASVQPVLRSAAVLSRPPHRASRPSLSLPASALQLRQPRRAFWTKKPDASVTGKQQQQAQTSTDASAPKENPVPAAKAVPSTPDAAAGAAGAAPASPPAEQKETLRERAQDAAEDLASDVVWAGPGPILTLKLWLLGKGVRMMWTRLRGKKAQQRSTHG